jgi:putative SOS response-associated peptidase YedK
MCFHNSMTAKAQALEQRYQAALEEEAKELEAIYHGNGFSFRQWPVITSQSPDKIQLFNWGLIPLWTKTTEDAKKNRINTLNARSETVFEKPSFRSISAKRCLIPSTGFYEWREYNKVKYPYFITLKDEPIFSMAGLYENWQDKATGEVFNTFSIITCPANPIMAKIHNSKERMPVILTKENEILWLRDELKAGEIKDLMQPLDENLMTAHTISKRITSRLEKTDVPEVMEEFVYAELPFL